MQLQAVGLPANAKITQIKGVVMTGFKSLLLASSLLALSVATDVEAAASIKVAVSFPTGSSGATIVKSLPTSTKISPCTAAKIDAATFTVTYDATRAAAGAVPASVYDVYIIFYNPEGANKFYSVSKDTLSNGVKISAFTDAVALAAGPVAPYVIGTSNFATGSVTDTLFGSSILVESLTTGTWQIIGILGDSSVTATLPFAFNDPATWIVWDAATVLLGSPWSIVNGASTPILTGACS